VFDYCKFWKKDAIQIRHKKLKKDDFFLNIKKLIYEISKVSSIVDRKK